MFAHELTLNTEFRKRFSQNMALIIRKSDSLNLTVRQQILIDTTERHGHKRISQIPDYHTSEKRLKLISFRRPGFSVWVLRFRYLWFIGGGILLWYLCVLWRYFQRIHFR